jgi:hypothetical protein
MHDAGGGRVRRACGLFASVCLGANAAIAAVPRPAPLGVELNVAAPANDHCRLSFVIRNGGGTAFASLKLDLVLFGRDGAISRRLIAEMGPLHAEKTVVKTFEVETDCAALGSILVNDVAACAPAEPSECLDRLELGSRLPDIRLFK